LNPIRPWSDVEGAGLTEIEQYRSGIVQQGEHPPWAVGGDQVEIGHAAPEQRVSRAEVVPNVQTRHRPGVSLARLVHLEQLGDGLAHRRRPVVAAAERRLRHRGLEHARTDRVALGLARMEAHYFVNRIFLPDNGLLDNIGRLRRHPATIVQAYPQLNRDRVRLAAIYATAHPRRGRPRTKTGWQLLKPKASEMIAFDEIPDR